MCEPLFDIDVVEGNPGAPLARVGKHLTLTRKQPQFVDLGELGHDAVGHVERDAVVAPLDLVEILSAREADVAGEIVGSHVRPLDDGFDTLPIIFFFSHFFRVIKIFFASLQSRSRSSMDRI